VKESDLQIQIVATLSAFSERCRFVFFSIPNEGSAFGSGDDRSRGAFAKVAKLKKMGMTPGVSDLVIIKYGRAYFLELKSGRNKQTVNQIRFEEWVARCGAKYHCTNSYDNAINVLKHWKILTPAS